jgi:cell division septum initiation protein DivIVA
MSMYRVIDKMEVVVREGVWLPFGWRALNADVMLDLVEKLRSTLPEEAARARRAGDGSEADAGEARGGVPGLGEGRVRAGGAASGAAQESEIIARAQSRADTIVAEAQAAARDIRRGADEYADQVLAGLDTSLGKALAAVQKGRQQLATSVTANGKSSEMSSL